MFRSADHRRLPHDLVIGKDTEMHVAKGVGALAIGILFVLWSGCGEDYEAPLIIVDIMSDQFADGDIGYNPSPPPEGTYTISQADVTSNLFFGIDSDGTEYRAFLDFPFDGSTGGGVVPPDAAIVSADIEVFVRSVEFSSVVPTLMELVAFPTTGLTPMDFDSLPILARPPFHVYRSDINRFIVIDVTSLMVEALNRALRELQVRLLLDFVPDAAGLVELDDSVSSSAPLLTVRYR